MIHQYAQIEVPFDFRHTCWFCGEPANHVFEFPHNNHIVLDCPHPYLSLYSCTECYSFAKQSNGNSIWQVAADVKRSILNTYQKDLAIGINWTSQELVDSQFEGGNFEPFQRSAWFMFEVAKARVNFKHWPIVVNGLTVNMSTHSISAFVFDGVTYPSIEDAIIHYANVFKLNTAYLRQVLAKVGIEQFSFAIRFCRQMISTTPDERKLALAELSNKG
jgi:hypothetical protein